MTDLPGRRGVSVLRISRRQRLELRRTLKHAGPFRHAIRKWRTMKVVIEVKELKVDLRGLGQLILVLLFYFH